MHESVSHRSNLFLSWIRSERTSGPAKWKEDQSWLRVLGEHSEAGAAGCNLAELASSQSHEQNPRREAIHTVGAEKGLSESLGKGTKQQEVHSAGQESSFQHPRWPLSCCVTLDESPHHPGLQIALLPNSRSGRAFLARSLSPSEFWFPMENRKKIFLFIPPQLGKFFLWRFCSCGAFSILCSRSGGHDFKQALTRIA